MPKSPKFFALCLLGMVACGPHYDDDLSLRDISGQQVVYDGNTTHTLGRYLTQADGTQVLSWAGSAVSTRFGGTGIDVALQLQDGQKQNFLQVVLDGNDAAQLTIDPNTKSYHIDATGAGPHDLTLVKLNEPMDGVIVFGGFTPSDGSALLPTQRPSGRRLLFIGDSITCGYGNEGVISTILLTSSNNPTENSLRDCNFFLQKQVYQVSSAWQSFSTQTARNLQAEWQLISWSGKGVYRNADGSTDLTIPDIWQRAVATDGNTTYEPSDFVPQAIVVNLGTNDFGSIAQSQNPNGGPPNIPLFTSRYLTLLKQVRTAFPNAWIFVATGPMLSDYYPTTFKSLSTMRTTLANIISTMHDRRIQYFEFPLNIATDTDATGCEWHPDTSQDTVMAARIQGSIQKALDWK